MINGFFGPYRFLSNFYERPIIVNGITFRSAENAFQSFKIIASNSDRASLFASCSPKEAKHLGKKVTLRVDWEDIKLDVMYLIVRIKFMNDIFLSQKLIDTGNKELIEGNTWGDTIWGQCNGIGENHLGKILMRVRAELIALG